MAPEEFERVVNDAIDRIPEEFAALLNNVAILIEPDAPPGSPPGLIGLYNGIPLTEREANPSALPDLIFIYRNPPLALCHTPEEVAEQVYVTVVHEVGHFFGIEDDELRKLGWG